ncbi:uncharacterized protein LOC106875478 isoform X2 [Octopus bimaculoides]|uniref:uncharacterized protein LOC106875478 isoform X2 n=1 Tax=Octopus bimaculoides TaxID=37653 RepID=UPI0022E15EB5|nr:uncharacterized protein LOC106875478 isoform X2 [Octopus bimaculoides]
MVIRDRMVTYAMAACDISKVSDCQDNYMKKSREMEANHKAFCKLSLDHLHCIRSASTGCGESVVKIIDQAKSKLESLKCDTAPKPKKKNGSNIVVAHSSVICGTFVAALTLKKLFL